jgi:MinD superfamily P-loop ATPase
MTEFGCDNWRLEDVNNGSVTMFKCSQTDANEHCQGAIPKKAIFDTDERARIFKEVLDCEHCEFNAAKKPERKLGKTAIKSESPYVPRPIGDLKPQEAPIARRHPSSHPYDASGR